MGLNIGNTPDSIQSIYDLNGNYTASNGRVILLVFIDPSAVPIDANYNDAENFLFSLQTIYQNVINNGFGANLKIVGILYHYDGSVDSSDFNDYVSDYKGASHGITFDLVNNGATWSGSPAENYITNYGASVTNPCVYIISKNKSIAYKTHLGVHADIVTMFTAINNETTTLLAGPSISSISPADGTLITSLNSVAVTFSEKIKKSDGSAVDFSCFNLGGAGAGLLHPHPSSSPDATELIYTLTTGDGTHTPGNGAIALDISRIVVPATDKHITDRVFYTPVPLVGNGGHDYYTVNYNADTQAPTIQSINSTTTNGAYKASASINIQVNFSEPVTLAGGNLNVTLDTGAVVSVATGAYPASQLSGTYAVVGGQNSTDLKVSSIALSAGTLQDAAGNNANLSLPAGNNLADNKNIVIDTAPPINAASYPKADTATTSGFTVRARTNENSTAYYVVIANGSAAPSAAQVEAGKNASGAPALASGSISSLTANTEGSAEVSGLSSNTDYDVYVVAEDNLGNIQASPIEIDIKTSTAASSAKNITGFVINSVSGTIGANTVTLSLPEGTVVTNLAPAITVSAGASVNPASGIAQNFTNPVTYIVKAEDASTKTYTVTVTSAYVYIRDLPGDNGTEQYVANGCYSPDIIIWDNDSADASTFDVVGDYYGGNIIEIGQPNYIYLRIINKSNAVLPAFTLKAKLFYGPLATLLGPAPAGAVPWEEITTSEIDIPAVPAASGSSLGYTVSTKIEWTPAPGTVEEGFDEYCLIAMFRNASTNELYPTDYTTVDTWQEYLEFVNNNKNVAFKNISTQDIVPNPHNIPKPSPMPGFHIMGFRKKFIGDLMFDAKELPSKSVLILGINNKIPGEKLELVNIKEIKENKKDKERLFQVNGNNIGVMKNLEFPENLKQKCSLKLLLSPKARTGKEYNIRVVQKVGKKALGSVNYIVRGIAFERAKYIGVITNHLVHKRSCRHLEKIKIEDMVPFDDLAAARKKGFDPALDCLNIRFGMKDVSGRMQYKILQYINKVKSHKELQKRVADTLGIGYLKEKYGETYKKGIGLNEPTAKAILRQRDRLGGFTRLEQVDKVVGVGKDTFIDIVNSFKESETLKATKKAKAEKADKTAKAKKKVATKKQAKPVKITKLKKAVKKVKVQKLAKPKTLDKTKKPTMKTKKTRKPDKKN